MKQHIALFGTGMFGILFGGLSMLLWGTTGLGRFMGVVFYSIGFGVLLYWLFLVGSAKQTTTTKAVKQVAIKKKSVKKQKRK